MIDVDTAQYAIDHAVAIRHTRHTVELARQAPENAAAQGGIEFRRVVELQIGNETRDERPRGHQLNFTLHGFGVRRRRRITIVEARHFAGTRRQKQTALDRVSRCDGHQPEEGQDHETDEGNKDKLLAGPNAAQKFPRRNIARTGRIRRGATAITESN